MAKKVSFEVKCPAKEGDRYIVCAKEGGVTVEAPRASYIHEALELVADYIFHGVGNGQNEIVIKITK